MHPALSVVAFTTLSGAGYGLLIWIGMLMPFHRTPLPPGYATVALFLALLLVTVGLLSSLAHLGHPERAWRALSQWRSSWLSREGVLALLAYAPAMALLALATGYGDASWARWIGPICSALALLVVACTAMIYASLKPIPAWHRPSVPVLYLALALASGAMLSVWLLAWFLPSGRLAFPMFTALISNLIGFVALLVYWRGIDRDSAPAAATALGLPAAAQVRPFEKPHSEDSFVTREMVFRFARERSRPLRRAIILLGLGLCSALILLAGGFPRLPAAALLGLAALCQLLAIFASRWLFFAEARHHVAVYYDVDGHAPR